MRCSVIPFGQYSMPPAMHSIPPAGFRPPLYPQENLGIPVTFTFNYPIPNFDEPSFNPTEGYIPTAGIPSHGEDNALNRWGANAWAMPPIFFPYYTQAQHYTDSPPIAYPSEFRPQPNFHPTVYEQSLVPSALPEFLRDTMAVPPISTKASYLPYPPGDQFVFEPLSPPMSVSSPGSSTSSGTSSPGSSLGKRQRDTLVDATPLSHLFKCKWGDCHETFTYIPKSDAGGLPEAVRVHIWRHFPAVQKQTEVPCRWGSCTKITARDNLRKHVVQHLPAFHYRCSGCDSSYQRPEKWYKHAEKCTAYLDSCGKPRPVKRVKRTTDTREMKN
jgi:uncharacterized C2H2 Zn-finger protein